MTHSFALPKFKGEAASEGGAALREEIRYQEKEAESGFAKLEKLGSKLTREMIERHFKFERGALDLLSVGHHPPTTRKGMSQAQRKDLVGKVAAALRHRLISKVVDGQILRLVGKTGL
ncbi:MAG: hypothetical protein AABX01_01040 [Candidatus Micrarchaeota archaeon]